MRTDRAPQALYEHEFQLKYRMQTPAPASADIYREARLALLGMQTRQQIERTDASARKVEAALARLKSDREIKAD